MKKIFLIALGVLFITIGASTQAQAGTFDAGRIIDDGVFTDASSLNPSQIQQFLESKVPSCDTWGVQASEFGGGTRRQWAEARGYAAPYTCLRDYSEGGKTASQIIYEAAQTFGISPKVLLVLLQKEQSLVTDTWPVSIQYRSATGYGCPDTAACDSQYYGLTNQVTWAARMFRAIINDSPTWYTPYILGSNYIRYSPDSACGGSTVVIQNRATQALYNYTPYQPNAGALAAGWGTAPCGAYGNRNFYLYYTTWFGSTTAAPSFAYSIISREFYSDANYLTRISDTPTVEPGSFFYFKLTIRNTGNQVWSKSTFNIGGEGPKNRVSLFASDTWLNGARPASMNELTVGENGTATFSVKMKAPDALGDYQEQFGVLIEGNRWLDGAFTLPITVASASPYYSVQPVSFTIFDNSTLTSRVPNQSALTLYTNSKKYVRVVLKNTGNQAFPAATTKLAPTNPADRASILSDSSWTNSSRVVGASEGNILPGASGTFTFSITAPGAPTARITEQFGLVIEGNRWVNLNVGSFSEQTVQRPPAALTEGSVLGVGGSILSDDERFTLILQGDGNLVLYKTGGRALWSSVTAGKGGAYLVMQYDGNLVLYRSDWTPIWHTRTDGNGLSRLIPQADGNLVLYRSGGRATWSSQTAGQQ